VGVNGVLDYIINLSIFSLMVSTPLIIRSFFTPKPLGKFRLLISGYAGIVSIILVVLAVKQDGFVYDIRYAPVILMFAYLGPIPGIITGIFALLARLYSSDNWMPAIIGWLIIVIVFSIIHYFISHLTSIKRCIILSITYICIYIITVPIIFNVIRNDPYFHFQYLLFVILGVIVGALLIESYQKLHRMNTALSETNKIVKSTQAELENTLKVLEASESKYRLIAENTSDLIMVMDKNHSISYFSPSHETTLGYQGEELSKTELCQFIHPDDLEAFKDAITKLFANKESYTVEFRLKHKLGHWIEFESRCMPVMGQRNAIEHIVMISRDISERKKAEEILLQSEKLSIVGELAAGVAHEIRNPLTTIKGFVQLYKKQDSSIEFSDLLLNELERIETITSELLSLGKPQAIKLSKVDIRELLESTLELLQPQAYMSNTQFELMSEGEKFYITCEKNQIKQVFLNILKNAMEAMKDGGDILLSLSSTGRDLVVSIKDKGCGIPEELLPRLGEPFYTLKEKGTGLGLMICHKIIKQHNGSITYYSKVNEGTLVEIKLPLSKSS
jgi:PAS domain S-box-containing protein